MSETFPVLHFGASTPEHWHMLSVSVLTSNSVQLKESNISRVLCTKVTKQSVSGLDVFIPLEDIFSFSTAEQAI